MGHHGGDTGPWPWWAGHSSGIGVGVSVPFPSFSVTLLTIGMFGFPQGDPGEVTKGHFWLWFRGDSGMEVLTWTSGHAEGIPHCIHAVTLGTGLWVILGAQPWLCLSCHELCQGVLQQFGVGMVRSYRHGSISELALSTWLRWRTRLLSKIHHTAQLLQTFPRLHCLAEDVPITFHAILGAGH